MTHSRPTPGAHQEVVEVTGASKRTIQRVGAEPPVQARVSRTTPPKRVGRRSKIESCREHVAEIFAEELLTVEILHRLRRQGYQGGKSALYELVPALRWTATVPVVTGVCGRSRNRGGGSEDESGTY